MRAGTRVGGEGGNRDPEPLPGKSQAAFSFLRNNDTDPFPLKKQLAPVGSIWSHWVHLLLEGGPFGSL